MLLKGDKLFQGDKGVDSMSEEKCNMCYKLFDTTKLNECDYCENKNLLYCDNCIDADSCNVFCNLHIPNEPKWRTQRGSIWRKLEDKRLKMEKNGHITTIIKNRKPTEKDERIFEFSHQLPKGNPNLLPGLPKEYMK